MGREEGLERWLGWRQVRELTGLGRTTAWRMRREGDFPDPVPISRGRVAWRARDIAAWTATRGVERSPAQTISTVKTSQPEPPAPPPSRRPEERVLASIPGTPARTGGDAVLEPPRARPVRRTRKTIAEGQLGFDF